MDQGDAVDHPTGYSRAVKMLNQTQTTLRDVLTLAGAKALSSFGSNEVMVKNDGSEVTEADLVCEEIIVNELSRCWPKASIKSEEGTLISGSQGQWFVDPIDGTSAYLDGLAYFGPTICYAEDGKLLFGASYFPRLNEFWFAQAGAGAYRNGLRLRPSTEKIRARQNQVLFVPSRFHRIDKFRWSGKLRALGSTAAHLAHVAAGGGVSALIHRWSTWDIGAGLLLALETNNNVINLDGTDLDPLSLDSKPFLVGTAEALKFLRPELNEKTPWCKN